MSAVRVRVPATTANLGPGFDALGIALRLYDRFEAEEAEGLAVEGCEPAYADEDNLFVRAYRLGLEELGLPFRGLRVRFRADIPIARGLGSSSACVVGGLLAASAAGGRGDPRWGALGRERILDLAARLEGHPDNAAPAVLGGFAVSVLEEGRATALRFPLGEELAFHALVPPFELSTAKARAALPPSVPFKDAVRNSGRAALVAAALAARDYGALGLACSDRLHEPYRAPLVPGFAEVTAAAREAGALAVFLSGAGPTVMALGLAEDSGFAARMAPALAARPEGAWRLLRLLADDEGAVLD
ncbi:MAG TPA: homoserine kinase [Spirochaetia bacterium]|nr:homoserine kinase [Spirochaetia bacterium]